jgi:hypothetical protein
MFSRSSSKASSVLAQPLSDAKTGTGQLEAIEDPSLDSLSFATFGLNSMSMSLGRHLETLYGILLATGSKKVSSLKVSEKARGETTVRLLPFCVLEIQCFF